MRGPQTLRIGGRSLRGRSYRFQHAQVRPTRQIVREAILNILRARVPVSAADTILVPFAGSGLLGFDLYSEFGCSIVFNDSDRTVCTQLRNTIGALALAECFSVQSGNIRQWTTRMPTVAGIVIDPPYQAGWLDDTNWLTELAENCQANWLLAESETAASDLDLPGFEQLVRREYGSTAIQLFARSDVT